MSKKQDLNIEDVASGAELEKIKSLTSEPKKESNNEIPRDVKFTKAQILGSARLTFNKDVLMILLGNEETYTIDEVEKVVEEFNKKEVK